MKLILALLALLSAVSSVQAGAQTKPTPPSRPVEDLVRSVVFLSSPVSQDRNAANPAPSHHIGTGFLFVIGADLYLVTAEHVANKMGDDAVVILSWCSRPTRFISHRLMA